MAKKVLVLCLGNDIIADDAVGIYAARLLSERVAHLADIEESAVSGVALLEIFVDYQRAIIIDAIYTQKHPPGTIIEMKPSDLDRVIAPSPHYAGLPELMDMAKQMELEFPQDIVIFAMEVQDPLTIGAKMTQPVIDSLPKLVERVEQQLALWADTDNV